jgi:hypothetical protein
MPVMHVDTPPRALIVWRLQHLRMVWIERPHLLAGIDAYADLTTRMLQLLPHTMLHLQIAFLGLFVSAALLAGCCHMRQRLLQELAQPSSR